MIAQLRKNVSQISSEHTCDYLHYVTLLICLRWSVVWLWRVIRKNIHRKTPMMDALFVCNFIKKWLQHRCFPENFAKLSRTSILWNFCQQMGFFWLCENFLSFNKFLPYPCSIKGPAKWIVTVSGELRFMTSYLES